MARFRSEENRKCPLLSVVVDRRTVFQSEERSSTTTPSTSAPDGSLTMPARAFECLGASTSTISICARANVAQSSARSSASGSRRFIAVTLRQKQLAFQPFRWLLVTGRITTNPETGTYTGVPLRTRLPSAHHHDPGDQECYVNGDRYEQQTPVRFGWAQLFHLRWKCEQSHRRDGQKNNTRKLPGTSWRYGAKQRKGKHDAVVYNTVGDTRTFHNHPRNGGGRGQPEPVGFSNAAYDRRRAEMEMKVRA